MGRNRQDEEESLVALRRNPPLLQHLCLRTKGAFMYFCIYYGPFICLFNYDGPKPASRERPRSLRFGGPPGLSSTVAWKKAAIIYLFITGR